MALKLAVMEEQPLPTVIQDPGTWLRLMGQAQRQIIA